MHFGFAAQGFSSESYFGCRFCSGPFGKETRTDMRRMLLLLSVFKALVLGIGNVDILVK